MAHNHKLNCKQCGNEFDCSHKRKYCSNKCRPSRIGAWTPVAKSTNDCTICGTSFDTHYGHRKYCSRACNMKAYNERHPGRKAKLSRDSRIRLTPYDRPVAPAQCKGCDINISHRAAYCAGCQRLRAARSERVRAECLRVPTTIACHECGNEFTIKYGDKRSVFCSFDCCARNHGRIAKASRRARERRTQVERVDPLKVFERDGWLCHLCGKKVNASQRGKMSPNAPELDHITPLAKGGSHTYENTACAHRKCNGAKSDKIIGQPSLFSVLGG